MSNNNIWFTSDTHYGHANILKYSKRPFDNIEQMNAALVDTWNQQVQPSDTIYHLGDVSFMDERKTYALLSRLNGNKILIYGNHDKMIKKSAELRSLFGSIHDYKEIYIDNIGSKGGKSAVIMSHFPMMTWNKAHHGSFMLHGHCHGNLTYPWKAKIMDVGVDPQGYRPISAAEVLNTLSSRSSRPSQR